MVAIARDVKVSRLACSRDHFFGLGFTVIGLGHNFGLMQYWSRSHTLWSCGLKSILTVFHVLLLLVSAHYKYFTSRKS